MADSEELPWDFTSPLAPEATPFSEWSFQIPQGKTTPEAPDYTFNPSSPNSEQSSWNTLQTPEADPDHCYMTPDHDDSGIDLGSGDNTPEELERELDHSQDMMLISKVVEKARQEGVAINSPFWSEVDTENYGMDCEMEGITDGIGAINVEEERTIPLRPEWLGTSPVHTDASVQLQVEGWLDQVIDYRASVVEQLSKFPYDPSLWLDLGDVDCRLGFTDIAAGNSYRGLLLIEAALNLNPRPTFPPNLGRLVLDFLGRKLNTKSNILIEDELNTQHLSAYFSIAYSLAGCGALWDCLNLLKIGLKIFPHNEELQAMHERMKTAFLDRTKDLKALGAESKTLVTLSRMGEILQKKYPWEDEKLYIRKPGLVKEINNKYASEKAAFEVRPVFFGTAEEIEKQSKRVVAEDEDVGPLGLFATRDLEEGELIMVDQYLLAVTDIDTDKMLYCDACMAYLQQPYFFTTNIVRPKCCSKVVFCSEECLKAAIPYHNLLCGKDFSWLEPSTATTHPTKGKPSCSVWRTKLFIRLLSLILPDLQKNPSIHPLQHPLLARMAANYPSPTSDPFNLTQHEYTFSSNTSNPLQILSTLGINIFTTPHFTHSTIQTILWRLENNANMSHISLFPPSHPFSSIKNTLVTLNPNYLFFNHSCEPNISWHGSICGHEHIEGLRDLEGKFRRPGCSGVWGRVREEGGRIKNGEELKISYIGDPRGERGEKREVKREQLGKWFEGGCGCGVCLKENEERRKDEGMGIGA